MYMISLNRLRANGITFIMGDKELNSVTLNEYSAQFNLMKCNYYTVIVILDSKISQVTFWGQRINTNDLFPLVPFP